MKHLLSLLLAIGAPLTTLATTPAAGDAQCAMLDKIAATAAEDPARSAALSVLEQIAKGANQKINADSEKQLGLTPRDLHHPAYNEVGVRVCALRTLGRTKLPGALDFLRSLSLSDTADDKSQTLWPAAQIAVREAALRGITDAGSRAAFLENVLKEPHDAMSKGAVMFWALEELCDAGAASALPRVRQTLSDLWAGQQFAQDEAVFCEDRMQVITRDTDRARALGSIFGSIASLESNSEGKRLIEWAMVQLMAMRTPSADAELERVAGDLALQAKNFPEDAGLAETKEFIDDILAARRK